MNPKLGPVNGPASVMGLLRPAHRDRDVDLRAALRDERHSWGTTFGAVYSGRSHSLQEILSLELCPHQTERQSATANEISLAVQPLGAVIGDPGIAGRLRGVKNPKFQTVNQITMSGKNVGDL